MDALQYFHYGQLIHHEKATGEMRVLAKTPELDDDFITFALATAKMHPSAAHQGISWGMLRPQRGQPMVISRAEYQVDDAIIYQFIALPTQIARGIAGNFDFLRPYLCQPLPIYAMLGDDLAPITLNDSPPDHEQYVDQLLDLMSYVRNNTRTLDPLIATVVTGKTLRISNAPPDCEQRLGFVQGLLTLLPASTRLGVTFSSQPAAHSDVKAQIMFIDQAPDDDDAIVFDWSSGAMHGDLPKSDYSRFVVGQMRLDPALVIRETEKLTVTAGWRFNQGDSLADALDYASYRAKVDQSLANGMPIEAAGIANILSQDPTLSAEQRQLYARHLINFSLALGDLQYIDAISPTMSQQPAIEDEVYQYMRQASERGNGALIFETLLRWRDDPFSPTGQRWQSLLNNAALSELAVRITEDDPQAIDDYLTKIAQLGTAVHPIIGRVIKRTLPFASRHDQIAPKLLLMATQHLSDDQVRSLLRTPNFLQPLAPPVKRLLICFLDPQRPAPNNAIMTAVQAMDDDVQDAALSAFIDQAYQHGRYDLLDARSLNALVHSLNKRPVMTSQAQLVDLVKAIQTHPTSQTHAMMPRLLLQLLLHSGQYDHLAKTITAQSRDVYQADGQQEVLLRIQEAFAKTRLPPAHAQAAIHALDEQARGGINATMATIGALQGTAWHDDMIEQADHILYDTPKNHRVIDILPASSMLRLIQFYARHGQQDKLQAAAQLMGRCAAHERGKSGLQATNRAYKTLHANPHTRSAALTVVQQYVREAPVQAAQYMIDHYRKRDSTTGTRLQTAYDMSLLMGRMSWETYADSLAVTVHLLQTLADAYQDTQTVPDVMLVRSLVESVRKQLSLNERKELHEDFRHLAQSILILGGQHDKRSRDTAKHNQAVIQGTIDPRSVLDVYRAAGGYLLKRFIVTASSPGNLSAQDLTYPFKLGDSTQSALHSLTSAEEWALDGVVARSSLVNAAQLQRAGKARWSYQAIIDDIDKQAQALKSFDHVMWQAMGRNWQRLADLIFYLYDSADSHVLEADYARGRRLDQQDIAPKDGIELLRFIYSAFSG